MSIVEQRSGQYGDPRPNLKRTAGLWSAYLGTEVTAHDVAQMMVLVKISRTKVPGVGKHDDNYEDQIGYSQIARMLR